MSAVFHQVPLYVILRHRHPKTACPIMKTVYIYDNESDVELAELCEMQYDYKYQLHNLPLRIEKWLNKYVYTFDGSYCESCFEKDRFKELDESHYGWTEFGEGE